jgi:hypothetical protein
LDLKVGALLCLQGYGDLHAYSVPEALFTIFYVFINIGVAAYIIGGGC